ncbi:hypothetical protein [Povalibacter sp.]|uniref:hypothetical protein n=1 Tax=Povalibacter sp. TaxID=1962978 RepID=UPI002F40034D
MSDRSVTSLATTPSWQLLAAFLAHVIATLTHFVHNGIYLSDYPNLPSWFTAAGVYASWCALTAVGLAGLALLRYVSTRLGLGVLILYGILGFGGLDHYTLASIAAHTTVMNLTILCESITGTLLLIAIVREFIRFDRARNAA